MPIDLSAVPLEDILDEIRRRTLLAPQQPSASIPVVPKEVPVKRSFWGRPVEPKDLPEPKMTSEVIPGSFKKDGSPRMLIQATPAGLERLSTEGDTRSAEDIHDGAGGGMRYIVRGEEREALARSFIEQWEAEIMALQLEAAELHQADPSSATSSYRIQDIETAIAQLKRQIKVRGDSAFNNMSFAEVQARNEQQNPGRVTVPPSLPGSASTSTPVEVVTGIPVFDTPALICFEANMSYANIIILLRELKIDPFRDSRGLHTLEIEGVINPCGMTKFKMPAEPTLVWRITALCQRLFFNQGKETRDDAMAFLKTWTDMIHFGNIWQDFVEPPFLLSSNPADDFRTRVLYHLEDARRQRLTEDEYRGVLRTIRVFNVDFKEREIPDEWFHQTDPEHPTGVQLQPHIDPRSAWADVPDGPGVSKRRT